MMSDLEEILVKNKSKQPTSIFTKYMFCLISLAVLVGSVVGCPKSAVRTDEIHNSKYGPRELRQITSRSPRNMPPGREIAGIQTTPTPKIWSDDELRTKLEKKYATIRPYKNTYWFSTVSTMPQEKLAKELNNFIEHYARQPIFVEMINDPLISFLPYRIISTSKNTAFTDAFKQADEERRKDNPSYNSVLGYLEKAQEHATSEDELTAITDMRCRIKYQQKRFREVKEDARGVPIEQARKYEMIGMVWAEQIGAVPSDSYSALDIFLHCIRYSQLATGDLTEAWHFIGEISSELGRRTGNRKYFVCAERVYETLLPTASPEILEKLAKVYNVQGKHSKAKRILEKMKGT